MAAVYSLSKQLSGGGHSTDSDEEIDTSSGRDPRLRAQPGLKSAVVVAGEASESDDDALTDPDTIKSNNDSELSSTQSPPSPSPAPLPPNLNHARDLFANSRYSSLLHRKLHERNEQLRRELIATACNPYNDATKEIRTVTQQLIKSQKIVHGVSSSLRKVTHDLNLMQAQLAALKASRQKIPQVIYTNNTQVDDACEADASSSSASPAIEAKELFEPN